MSDEKIWIDPVIIDGEEVVEGHWEEPLKGDSEEKPIVGDVKPLDYVAMKKRVAYESALIKANDLLKQAQTTLAEMDEPKPEQPTKEEVALSYRNQILANDPETEKGKLLGTTTDEPTATKEDLAVAEIADSESYLAECTRLRAEALALIAVRG